MLESWQVLAHDSTIQALEVRRAITTVSLIALVLSKPQFLIHNHVQLLAYRLKQVEDHTSYG